MRLLSTLIVYITMLVCRNITLNKVKKFDIYELHIHDHKIKKYVPIWWQLNGFKSILRLFEMIRYANKKLKDAHAKA